MLHIFTKKEYLVDHLEGFIDIHNHILPGIDDGAKNVNESIALIKAFGEFGVKNFICTPHIMSNYYENTSATIQRSYKELKKELEKLSMNDISLDYAAEHMIDAEFDKILEQNHEVPLGKYHLLIEMSYLQISINFNDCINKIKAKGRYPILAHPERYNYLHKDLSKYKKYKSQGVKFQLNLLSLGITMVKSVRNMAIKLLKAKQYEVAGSDVHNKRQLEELKKITLSNKELTLLRPILENRVLL